MRIRRVFLILMIPLIIETIISCCDCSEYIYDSAYIDYYTYSHANMMINSIDNSGANPIIPLTDTIQKSAYGLHMIINRLEIAEATRPAGFIQSAYAFSCDCPGEYYYYPADSILSIRIITANDFDADHMAGADISKYFLVYKYQHMYPIESFISNSYYGFNDLEENLLEIYLLLMNEPDPDFSTNHQFTVQMEISDGRILEETTNLLTLI